MTPDRNRVYWAAEAEKKKFCGRARERFAWCQTQLAVSGRLERAIALLSAYYGHGTTGLKDSSRLVERGDQGEITELHVNGVAPIITNIVGLIAGQRPAIKPNSTNGDAASSAATRLAAQLHRYYDDKDGGQSAELSAVRGGVLATSWWLIQSWLNSAGSVYAQDENGGLLFEGDIQTLSLPPWKVAADPIAHEVEGRNWVIFQRRLSRWDLAPRIQDEEVREKLLRGAYQESTPWLSDGILNAQRGLSSLMGDSVLEEDGVTVWEVRHLKTPALPMGRLVQFFDEDCVLFDSLESGYPYEGLHAFDFAPERVVGSTNGHSSGVNLLALQELMDVATTSLATTLNLLGLPHIWGGPNGEGPPSEPFRTRSGITIIEGPSKPELVDMPALKPEVQGAADWTLSQMRMAGALNDVVMGSPPKGMPASAQALQRAQAVQFHQVAQMEYIKLVRSVVNGRLRLLKRFAQSKRVAAIAGVDGRYEVVEFQREDIAGVPSFSVEVTNPMSASFEARQATAEFLAGRGMLSPEGFWSFLQTGNLDAEMRPQTAWKELVERNKSLLAKGVGLPLVDGPASMQAGEPVFLEVEGEFLRPLKSDPHHLAIPVYLSVANDPAVRAGNPQVVTAVTDVVTESLRLWQSLTPDECRAFGIPLLPSQEMGAVAPLPGGPPASEAGGVDDALTETGLPDEAPGLPKPPVDPLTGTQETTDSLGGLA